jgi:drug/metabolite transporter (DMT)-like permease
VFAAVFLGERLTAWRVGAVALGFAGVLLIVRPGAAIIHPAAFAAIAAAVCFAATYVITKSMVAEERPMTILFWMHLTQLPLGLAPALYVGWTHPPVHTWPWVAALGIAGYATHYCIAKAMSHADATVVAPLDFLRLPLGALIGWAFYAEVLDPVVVLGAAVIVSANWMNLRYG